MSTNKQHSLLAQPFQCLRQRFYSYHQNFKGLSVKPVWLLAVSLFTLSGCAAPEMYREEHQLTDLHIVFLDKQSLHNEWEARTGRPGVEFMASRGQSATPQVTTLKGFFDFSSNTLYCPKWDFEVCGHELHHAALGHWHPAHH